MKRVPCCAAALFFTAVGFAGPAFDAASVKVAAFIPGQSRIASGGPGTSDPGRITYTRVALIQILEKSYDVRFDQIQGPKWISDNSNLFNIVATLPPDTPKEQFQLMLQSLLAERLHVTLHHETRAFPGYQLVVASGGPKFRESPPAVTDAPAGRGGMGMGRDGNLRLSGPGSSAIYFNGAERMGFKERTMKQFVSTLGNAVSLSNGAPAGSPIPVIVDKTGLTGKYDFSLNFTCANDPCAPPRVPPSQAALPGGGVPVTTSGTSAPNRIPNLFAALEKQLGLKLEKTRDAAVDVLIIDHADRIPTEN